MIPEFTKVFTSSHSRHVQEVVSASKEGGASLNILSGLVAGNFSVFWKALTLAVLLFLAFTASRPINAYLNPGMPYGAVFAFGLVAFGLLGMGPVTIAVDSYGPVTDNAQSIFELSQVETTPGAAQEIEKQFGFKPDFEKGKHYLEDNDGAGNTFKATAEAGAHRHRRRRRDDHAVLDHPHAAEALRARRERARRCFKLDLLDPYVLLGLLMGGGTVYWFTGASIQAVTTGAYRAVEYIKKNIKLDSAEAASIETSRTVVRICTQYAQAGMFNIFMVIFCLTIAYAFFNPSVLHRLPRQHRASSACSRPSTWRTPAARGTTPRRWSRSELNAKGTELHDASIVGDTVGDPYKDTSSVALEPDHQVHDAVRPARGRDGGREPELSRRAGRGGVHADRTVLRLPLVLRDAHLESAK